MNKAIETNNNKTMQNYYKTIGALVVASAFAAGNASAEIESEVHVGYTNEYLFRGIDLGQTSSKQVLTSQLNTMALA